MDHCITDQTFEKKDFTGHLLKKGEYENCVFSHCNLSGADLSEMVWDCNEFGLSFNVQGCTLDQSSFYQVKLKKTVFRNTQLKEADFTACDLTEAVFDNCDLLNAVFDGAVLEKSDLRTAYNYSIDPEKNRIKKARFSSAGLSGLLDKYNIQID